MLFNDQRDNEADQSQSLAEGGAHDEDGEHAALDLRLTGHSTRSTQSRQADSKTSAANGRLLLLRDLLCLGDVHGGKDREDVSLDGADHELNRIDQDEDGKPG